MILPKLSVIMPVFNAELYLQESIQSVVNQTFVDFELVILNDNSSDGSKNIILDFQKKDARIVYHEFQTNQGPAVLRNFGIDNSKGSYIAFNDADDISLPSRFYEQVLFLDKNPNIGVCGSNYVTFGANLKQKLVKKPQKSEDIRLKFLTFNCIGNSTVMLKKSCLGSIRLNPKFITCEDYNFWSELVLVTDFFNLKKPLVKYRVHDNSLSNANLDKFEINDNKIAVCLATNLFQIPEHEVDDIMILDIFKYKKKSSTYQLTQLLLYSKKIILWNEKSKKVNPKQLQNRLNYLLTKSIKNGAIDFQFLNSVANLNNDYFTNLRFYQKINFYFKAIFASKA